MKVYLAHPDRDLDLEGSLPPNTAELAQDLGMEMIFRAMARGDAFLFDVAKGTVFRGLDDPGGIHYRQAVLADCLAQRAVVRRLYAIAVDAIERERRLWGRPSIPDSLLRRSVDALELFIGSLRQLRAVTEEHAADFSSVGFSRLCLEITAELDGAYLRTMEGHLERLRFRDGVRLSARLGTANRGTEHVLRRRVRKAFWRERIGLGEPDSFTWQLPERDEAGAQALGEVRGQGIALAADALARSTDHILSYFKQLRTELGFYIGCLNLQEALEDKGEPTCLPDPQPAGSASLAGRGLYDVALSLSLGAPRAIGNDVEADGRSLIVITGANRGGKSTFLRSLGLAQLLMQAGMIVPAAAFRADIRDGLFTHFKREEDPSLRSGRLDEELGRISTIVDHARSGSMVLFNESFASTNEREGSEIARQIVRALLEGGVKVVYVTHMYDLAKGFHDDLRDDAQFLRAERLSDGRRTYRVIEGEPLPTSHGEDVYRRIFGDDQLQTSRVVAPAIGSPRR